VVKQDRPLFPGYIFVRIPFTERAKVLMLPNVVSLVGVKTSPSVVSEEEIAWIRAGMDQAQAEPHPYCKVGERVMITQGALAGVEGVLLREGKRPRVVITVESIHRSFSVEVEAGCIGVAEKPIFDPVSQDAVRPGAASVREKISLH
jgi:transcription antitermination factor NusG